MKTTVRIAMCSALIVLASSACGHSKDHSEPAAVSGAKGAPAAAVPGTAGGLAIESYLTTGHETAELTAAQSILVSRCLKSQGFDYPVLSVDKIVEIPDLKGRYGPVSDDEANLGYRYMLPLVDSQSKSIHFRNDQLPPQTPALLKALSGSDRPNANTPPGGCEAEAHSELWGTQTSTGSEQVGQQIKSDSFTLSQNDSRVVGVFAKWSACMKSAGFSYPTPSDVQNDPRWGSGTTASKEEIATAHQDVACKKSTGLVDTWLAVENEIERKEIDKNIEALTTGRAEIDSAVKNAAKLVGQ